MDITCIRGETTMDINCIRGATILWILITLEWQPVWILIVSENQLLIEMSEIKFQVSNNHTRESPIPDHRHIPLDVASEGDHC